MKTAIYMYKNMHSIIFLLQLPSKPSVCHLGQPPPLQLISNHTSQILQALKDLLTLPSTPTFHLSHGLAPGIVPPAFQIHILLATLPSSILSNYSCHLSCVALIFPLTLCPLAALILHSVFLIFFCYLVNHLHFAFISVIHCPAILIEWY